MSLQSGAWQHISGIICYLSTDFPWADFDIFQKTGFLRSPDEVTPVCFTVMIDPKGGTDSKDESLTTHWSPFAL